MLSIADVLTEFPRAGQTPWLGMEAAFEPDLVFDELALDEPAEAVVPPEDEAITAIRAEAAAAIEACRAASAEENAAALVAARAQWASEEGDRIAASLAGGLAGLEASIGAALAAVMRPLMGEALRARIADEVALALRQLLTGSQGGVIALRGPADLLAVARAEFADNLAVVLVDNEEPDVTIEAGDTTLVTRLEVWRTRLQATLEETV